MSRIPLQRWSQIGIGVLLLIVVRCLAEVFRLQYVHGANLPIAEVLPYVGSALATAIALTAALIGQACGYYRAVGAGTVATALALLAYKIAFIG